MIEVIWRIIGTVYSQAGDNQKLIEAPLAIIDPLQWWRLEFYGRLHGDGIPKSFNITLSDFSLFRYGPINSDIGYEIHMNIARYSSGIYRCAYHMNLEGTNPGITGGIEFPEDIIHNSIIKMLSTSEVDGAVRNACFIARKEWQNVEE